MKTALSFLFIILIMSPACRLEPVPFNQNPANPTDHLTVGLEAVFSPTAEETWTVMIYIDGAVDLEPQALLDFKEMELGLYQLLQREPALDGYLNIIVLFDRIAGYSTDADGGDWTDTRLYRIRPSAELSDPFASEQLFDPDGTYGFATADTDTVERNMAHPDTLHNFIDYTTTHTISDHYALVIWNHGDGPRSDSEGALPRTARSIAEDNESGYEDLLSIEELQQALEASAIVSSGGRLDLVGFDACLMGAVEIAYELRDSADFMVASMANEYSGGWNYKALLEGIMPGAGSAGARALSALLVGAYAGSAGQNNTMQTLSAVKLSGISALKTAIDGLAVSLYAENRQEDLEILRDNTIVFYQPSDPREVREYPYLDLNDFCYGIIGNPDFFSAGLADAAEAVLAQLGQVVVAAYAGETYGGYLAPGSGVKRGLSLVFPLGDRSVTGDTPLSYYAFSDWYTSVLLQSTREDASDMGQLDFCTFNSNGIVESWVELLQAWYDPHSALVPWNSY